MAQASTHTKEVEQVFESGWQWVVDDSHPYNQQLGFYTALGRDDAYGWYTKEGHPQKNILVGDSRPRWMAAKTVLSVYS
jgi:hypothetical protein